jgi:ribulose-phosphate 3-epimerase
VYLFARSGDLRILSLKTRNIVQIELAPSILSADFSRLGEQARAAIDGGGTVLHVDIMDGHFVPNITIGPPVVASLRKPVRDVPFDCHLMIENPDEFIPAFAEAGATWMSVHQEACVHLDRTLHLIESHGCKPAVVINPATPVATLDEVLDIVHHVLVMSVNPGFGAQRFIPNALRKIEALARIREKRGLAYRIEVDGGVDMTTVGEVVRAGADLLVAGNAVFGHGDPKHNAAELLRAARANTLARA